jgi:hypothetical protein
MGEWAPTPTELAHEDAVRNPTLYWAVFIAEAPGVWQQAVVEMASAGRDARARRCRSWGRLLSGASNSITGMAGMRRLHLWPSACVRKRPPRPR